VEGFQFNLTLNRQQATLSVAVPGAAAQNFGSRACHRVHLVIDTVPDFVGHPLEAAPPSRVMTVDNLGKP
jgi:hypothetical protein